MIQLSEEGQKTVRIAIFVAIAIGLVLLFFFVSSRDGSSENDKTSNVNSSLDITSDSPIEEENLVAVDEQENIEIPVSTASENPQKIEEFENLLNERDEDAIEKEIAAYKIFGEKYVEAVNNWNYETDLTSWAQDIFNIYGSDTVRFTDLITRLSKPMLDECKKIECSTMGFGEFFNEEIPSLEESDWAGYFKVSILTTDKSGNESVVDTFWLVEATLDEEGSPKITYVEDMQTDEVYID
jgi:hypothetical protein